MDLPKNEKSFKFNEIGETTGQVFEGDFTVKCILNIKEKKELEIEKSRVRADVINPTQDLLVISMVLATLKCKIIDAPKWWKNNGSDLMDENIIYSLYEKVSAQEDAWKKELKANSEASSGN